MSDYPVQRLRLIGAKLRSEIADERTVAEDAADEILRLRAENEKLRAALKPFADIAKQTGHWSGPPVSVPLYVIRAAAAALKETGDD